MKTTRFISFVLSMAIFISLFASSSLASSNNVGDIVNEAAYTDIVAYINDVPIRSYNINGNTAIIAEDLLDYGFAVIWYAPSRSLNIGYVNIDSIAVNSITGENIPSCAESMIGEKAYDVLYSDIQTYVKEKLVSSFNINGSTAIYFDDLSAYGEIVWNPQERKISLNISANKYGTIYYSSGALRYEGELKNGIYNGFGKLYYRDGQLYYVGNFKDGSAFGRGIYYSKDGWTYIGKFSGDMFNGYGEMYDANGIIAFIGNFKYGVGYGEWHDENGNPICVIFKSDVLIASSYNVADIVNEAIYTDIVAYINDVPIRSYNINGKTAIIVEDLSDYGFVIWNQADRSLKIKNRDIRNTIIVNPINIPSCAESMIGEKAYDVLYSDVKTYVNNKMCVSFYINGSTAIYFDDLSEYGEIVWDPKERKISLDISKIYYASGALLYEGELENGTYNGFGKLYYEDGKLQYVGNFKDGYYFGKGIMYSKGGSTYIGEFNENGLNGYVEAYDADGIISFKGNYKDNKMDGYGEMYFENGIVVKGNFKDGKKDGYSETYDENGNLLYSGTYKDGVLISENS